METAGFAIACSTTMEVLHATLSLSHAGDWGDLHEGPGQEEKEGEEEEAGEGGVVEGEDLGDDQRHLEKSWEEEEVKRAQIGYSKLPFCQQTTFLLGRVSR